MYQAVLGDGPGGPYEESAEQARALGPRGIRRHPAGIAFVAIPIKIVLVAIIFFE